MKKKIYEMPDKYKRDVAELEKQIKKRDQMAREVKDSSPARAAQGRMLIARFDKLIERYEASLAAEYEEYQAERRKEDEISEAIKRGTKATEILYVIIKHKMPKEKFEEFHNIATEGLLPDELEEFYDNVAILEATRLDELLAENTTPTNSDEKE